MKMKVCSVFDSKAEAYLQPFYSRSRGEALRAFEDAVNREGSFKAHVADYTLFEIGEFDDSSGQIVMHYAMVNLGCAIEFLRKEGV